jgi:hypothetical protein
MKKRRGSGGKMRALDLAVKPAKQRRVAGGATRKVALPDIVKTPAPSGPVPLPYPN